MTKHFYAKEFPTETNPLPRDFRNRIVCADALAALKTMPDNCVDLVFTSPPYNFDMGYDQHQDDQDWEQYFTTLNAVLDECIRVLKHGGRLIINIQPLLSDYVPTHHLISQHLLRAGLIWKTEILWEKSNYSAKVSSWGSWKSPSSPYFKITWEFVEVFCKGDLKKTPAVPGSTPDLTAEEFKQWTTAKWAIAPERHMKEFNHPAMFPLELADRCIRLFSFPGDAVLDPFCGAGTACVAAYETNRIYCGIDISEEYCRTALIRLGRGACFEEE